MIVVDVKELELNLDKYIELAKKETIQVLKENKPIFTFVPNIKQDLKSKK